MKPKEVTIIMEPSAEEWAAERRRVMLIVGNALLPALQRLADAWAAIDLEQDAPDYYRLESRKRLAVVVAALCLLLMAL